MNKTVKYKVGDLVKIIETGVLTSIAQGPFFISNSYLTRWDENVWFRPDELELAKTVKTHKDKQKKIKIKKILYRASEHAEIIEKINEIIKVLNQTE